MAGQQLVMGEGQAEEIRKLHHDMAVWLAQEYNCLLCCEDAENDVPEKYLKPDPGCPLCKGEGTVTGEQIEEYAVGYGERLLLPDWWPEAVYVDA